ncbi:MAG: hypothetical protein ACK4SY_02340 [Pyrobaculum sp.]
MKVVRSKTYVFEGQVPGDVVAILEKWGRAIRRDAITVYTIEQGEIRAKKVSESPSQVVRRIYINPHCGCVLELDEIKDFERDNVSYVVIKKKICQTHQQ